MLVGPFTQAHLWGFERAMGQIYLRKSEELKAGAPGKAVEPGT